MTAIKGVLFDKDGTLIDFEGSWLAFARGMALMAADGDAARAALLLEQAGYDPATGRFRAGSVFAAGTNADVVALWHPRLSGGALAERIAAFNDFGAKYGAKAAVALPGMHDTVSLLYRHGYLLGVATNDSERGAVETLAVLGLSEMFVNAYGFDSVARPKPAPDVVLTFAGATGLDVREVAMVGDNAHDVMAGRAAGCGLVVGVLSGNGTRQDLAQADEIVDSIADLPVLLERR